LLAVLAAATAFFFKPKFGLDIQGGARVVLEADTSKLPQGRTWNAEAREAVVKTIENRINSNGVSEPIITPKGEKQIVVELPAVRNEREILEQLQTTAQLQFFYSTEWETRRNPLGRYRFDSVEGTQLYQITDKNTQSTFRDLAQLNVALRDMLNRGTQAGDKAQTVALPTPLPDLSAAAGAKEIRVSSDDAAKLSALADEAKNFNAFLSTARLELDGSDILPTAMGGFDPGGRQGAIIELQFNNEGTQKFARFTRDHTNEILMIYLDGRILTAPNIENVIPNGRAQISGFETLREAKQVADYLNGGALPVPLKIVQQQSVEPTLGTEAVRQSVLAGAVGFLAVAAFMGGYYLLPGAVAIIALTLYTLFTYALFVLIGVTFTLPGIAGFILSVGMAVDANILIFERTKEELRAGRALRPAVESGFQRAFSAILDSNVCTAVTSILLYYFGTGAVRGFALTLLIGVAVSMFTAITVSRTLLLLLVGTRAGKNLASWGVNRQIHPRMNVVGKRSFWYTLSLAIIVPGVIAAAMGGFKPGIDFTGGTELTLQFTQPVTRTKVEEAVRAQGFTDPAAQIAGGNTVFVRLPAQKGKGDVSAQDADRLVQGLQTQFPGVTRQGFESIGSSISSELTRNAFLSILLSSVFIVLYLAFRFAVGGFANGVKFGVGAVIAMLHDVGVLVGVFCALGYFLNWKIDSLFVTAALTVIGFSVHDTIVIFDRIRENLKLHGSRKPFDELVNESINETFARSVFTSLTVVLTLVALLVLAGPVIRPLNAALLIGIVSGTFSSIFNAAPLVVDWQRLFGSKTVQGAERTSRTGGGSGATGRTTDRPTGGTGGTAKRDTPKPSPTPSGSAGNARVYPSTGDGTGIPPGPPARPQLPGGPRPRRRRM
jgi:SecD/SecF fusion protein